MAKAKHIKIVSDQDKNLIDSPEEQGERGPGGSTEGLRADDNVQRRAASMGLYGDNPGVNNQDMTPVGIAEQVQQAENARRGIDKDTFSDDD